MESGRVPIPQELSTNATGDLCARRMIPLESRMRENRTSGSESGDWKRDRGAGLRPEAKATEVPPDPTVNAPVLDSTE